LPVALAILDVLLPILGWFMDLPEEAKMVIGVITALGVVFGTFLMVVGTVGLGIGSLVLTLPTLVAGFTTVLSFITGAVGTLVGVLTSPWAIIIGVIVAFIAAIVFNWEGFVKAFVNLGKNLIGAVMTAVDGIVEIFEGLIDFFTGVFTGDWEKAFGGLEKIVDGFLKLFLGFPRKVVSAFANFGADLVGAIATGIRRAYHWVLGAIRGIPIIGPIIAGGISGVVGIGKGVASAIGSGIRSVVSGVRGLIGLQHGGIITKPTIAAVGEAGPEAVIPLNKVGGLGSTSFNPTINVSATVSSDSDIRDLAEKLNRYMIDDFRRHNL